MKQAVSSVAILCSVLIASLPRQIDAQVTPTNDPPQYGPFNATLLPDGDGLEKKLAEHDTLLRADSPWSLYGWIWLNEDVKAPTLVVGMGNPNEEYPRYLALDAGKLILWIGKDNSIEASAPLTSRKWLFVAGTFDGSDFHLYFDGQQVASGKLGLGSVGPEIHIAPPAQPGSSDKHFGGKIAGLTVTREALDPDHIKSLHEKPPDFAAIAFEEGSKPWPVQTRGQAGYRAPQDPSTMPHSRAAVPAEPSPLYVHKKTPIPTNSEWIEEEGYGHFRINGWLLKPAPDVKATGAELSNGWMNTGGWIAATVPGTVLTSMIRHEDYPDPDYGLNNLAIPESLNKKDYWYRTVFGFPAKVAENDLKQYIAGQRYTLTFEGINYEAEVWFNGDYLGNIKGAFKRGVFDVTDRLKTLNVLAVKVSPPPHPGIPQEQSIKGGPGENGGAMLLDGPTFVDTEGWDWIPAIRDRNTGIWQQVRFDVSGMVKIGDAQVVTTLPLPDTSRAEVTITVPLENFSSTPVHGTLKASFEQVEVTREVTVAPGKAEVKLTPAEFSQLNVQHPRLWWPNGYGKQDLYHLKLSFHVGDRDSDSKQVRFGIREITYELSLFDPAGHLRRLEYRPSRMNKGERVVDVTHEGIRQIPAADPPPSDIPQEWRPYWKSWAASLAPGADSSPAVRMIDDPKMQHYLVIQVNGVRIACRGGSWGMDDSRKRVTRERLEPYFKLHHDANVNIIRNWVGQNTEETFFDLADEYGLLVWNDFWESTQDYNLEPQDPALFLDNARDTILRFRNHPSIAVWCGRNEGVPQPIINEGLDELTRTLDGTRYYSPSSNQVNLQNSGPYKYMDPALYYTTLNHGFSVETGTPSFSTLESFRASIPRADQWPPDDVWAYHDWHMSGNGDMAPFMDQIQAEFGAATSLEDFERKAQMLNYVDHRAIFEGMNQHLWAPNSGRMLWMTQPAWPSNTWQILSHDYDTQASYYGVKKACEPLHVQLDLSNYTVTVVNTTTESQSRLTVGARVYSLENKQLLQREEKQDVATDSTVDAFRLDLGPLFSHGVLLVKLELRDSGGKLDSDNLYWIAPDSQGYRPLSRMPQATVAATNESTLETGGSVLKTIKLENRGNVAALETKLTLLDSKGERILPAYYSDNYVSLLPGETKEIAIRFHSYPSMGVPQLSMRGWNVPSRIVVVEKR